MADAPPPVPLDYKAPTTAARPDIARRVLRKASIGVATAAIGLVVLVVYVRLTESTNYSREMARRRRCTSDLEQVGLAVGRYAASHGGTYPDTLDRLVVDAGLPRSAVEYGYDYVGAGLTAGSVHATTVVAFEHDWCRPDGSTALFGDGHAFWLGRKAAAFLPAAAPTTR